MGRAALTLPAWAHLPSGAPEGAFEQVQHSHACMHVFSVIHLFIYMHKISEKEVIVQLLLVKDFRLQTGEVTNAVVNRQIK